MGLPMGLRFRGRSVEAGSTCLCHSRRQVLAGAGAVVAAALLPTVGRGQVASPAVRSIDVHHHIYPPRYQADNYPRIVENIGPGSAAVSANWSAPRAVEKMDQAGVAVAINSISSPGVWFDDGEAGRGRARECNEF